MTDRSRPLHRHATVVILPGAWPLGAVFARHTDQCGRRQNIARRPVTTSTVDRIERRAQGYADVTAHVAGPGRGGSTQSSFFMRIDVAVKPIDS